MSESEVQTPLEVLQSIYADEAVALSVRMRAAVEAAPYVHAKQATVAHVVSFASQMEELGRSSGRSNVIDAQPILRKVEVLREKD